jgi:hypothetical protein
VGNLLLQEVFFCESAVCVGESGFVVFGRGDPQLQWFVIYLQIWIGAFILATLLLMVGLTLYAMRAEIYLGLVIVRPFIDLQRLRLQACWRNRQAGQTGGRTHGRRASVSVKNPLYHAGIAMQARSKGRPADLDLSTLGDLTQSDSPGPVYAALTTPSSAQSPSSVAGTAFDTGDETLSPVPAGEPAPMKRLSVRLFDGGGGAAPVTPEGFMALPPSSLSLSLGDTDADEHTALFADDTDISEAISSGPESEQEEARPAAAHNSGFSSLLMRRSLPHRKTAARVTSSF